MAISKSTTRPNPHGLFLVSSNPQPIKTLSRSRFAEDSAIAQELLQLFTADAARFDEQEAAEYLSENMAAFLAGEFDSLIEAAV